jgi:hypothetical protein
MNRLFFAVVAAVLVTGMVGSAEACYCGAARRAMCCQTCCRPAAQQCCTVMKTCQQVVLVPKPITCYRTEYRPFWEMKTVTGVRNVCQTRYRECTQTILRPVYETVEREESCSVTKPVSEMQTVKVCNGHWETKNVECCVPNPKDPCGPAVKTMKQCRVWKMELVDKQVECIRFVTEIVMKKMPCQVCKMVPEQIVHRIPYTIVVPQQYTATVPCVRYVPQEVPFTVTQCEPQTVTVEVPVQVCCPTPCCGK